MEHKSTLTEIWKKKYKTYNNDLTQTCQKNSTKWTADQEKNVYYIWKMICGNDIFFFSIGPVILVAFTEATKCSNSSSFIVMWQCVTPKNDTGSCEYQELMGELCNQALAAEFTNGSLIFIQVAMPLKIWVVRGYQYNIVAPVMATRVTFPIVNFKEYMSGTCIDSLTISWLFHFQYDQIITDTHYKMFSDQYIFCFRFESRLI